ncbi:MAG: hypothetical protein ACKO1O_14785 [Erythrobacter sp.]
MREIASWLTMVPMMGMSQSSAVSAQLSPGGAAGLSAAGGERGPHGGGASGSR